MKLIKAIIKPHTLASVQKALSELGIEGFTLHEVRGMGHEKGGSDLPSGREYTVDLLPRLMIEVVVKESLLESALSSIQKAAHSGKIGDGKLFVLPIEESVCIRTGVRGDASLS